MKNNRGNEVIQAIIVIVCIILFIVVPFGWAIFKSIYSRTAGNKTAVDLKYKYEKAITSINGEKFEIDIDTWSDYEGEQIQIIGKDGKVYLVSSFNTILIGE